MQKNVFVISAVRTAFGALGGTRYALVTMCIGSGQGIAALLVQV